MSSIRCIIVLLLVTPLFAAYGTTRPAVDDETVAAFVDDFLTREVTDRNIPGATVVLVRDGRVVFSRTYGVADYDSGRPISSDDSLLRLGSTAKMFVWVLAMQLVEEGRLDLDADINRYLDFRIPEAFGAPITMRHLMTHSAGFADRIPMVDPDTRRAPFPVRIRENIPHRVNAPGSTIAYSNYGAALAGYIVERLRGKPFESVVEERLFVPLKMTRSTLAQPLPDHLEPLLVSSYSASSRTPAPFDFVGLPPAGSASASNADMGRFLSMLMTGGVPSILEASTLDRMMRLQKPLATGLSAGLGLGFIVGEYRGVRYAGHGGSMPAGTTDLEILPDHGLGWYLGFNGRGANGSAVPLRQEFLRAFIDRFYAPAVTAAVPRGPSTAKDVEGKYLPTRRVHSGALQIFNGLGALVVEAEGGALLIELESGPTRWLPAGSDRFVEERTGLPLAVSRDSTGRIVRLGSPLLNSVSQYEPAPAAVRYLPLLLAAAAVFLALAVVPSLWRGVNRLRNRNRRRHPASTDPRPIGRWAAIAVWLIVVAVAGWALYMVVTIVDPAVVNSSRPVAIFLSLLSTATPIAALLIALDAVATWRNPVRSRWVAAGRTVSACSALAVVWLLFAFGFAGTSLL